MGQWNHPSLLADAQPCQGLGQTQMEAVWNAGRVGTLMQGEALFTQGAPAERCYVLLAGCVKLVQVTDDGSEVVVNVMTPGEMVGCLAAVGASAYPSSAIAMEPSVVIGWTHGAFQDLTLRYPVVGFNTMRLIGDRMEDAHRRVLEMATKTAEQRIAATLLRLARRRGDRPAEGAAFRAPITISRGDIAALSGTRIYTVCRTLQSWSRARLVEIGRCRVAVRDAAGLQAIYDGRAQRPHLLAKEMPIPREPRPALPAPTCAQGPMASG